jgi:hypothetical protein
MVSSASKVLNSRSTAERQNSHSKRHLYAPGGPRGADEAIEPDRDLRCIVELGSMRFGSNRCGRSLDAFKSEVSPAGGSINLAFFQFHDMFSVLSGGNVVVVRLEGQHVGYSGYDSGCVMRIQASRFLRGASSIARISTS